MYAITNNPKGNPEYKLAKKPPMIDHCQADSTLS
jgi:hypothetical protein